MNILEEFDKYKKEYAKKNKLSEINDSINKYWQLAWQSFMNEVLVPNWQDIKDSYLTTKSLESSYTLKASSDVNHEDAEEFSEDNVWEQVKNYLK